MCNQLNYINSKSFGLMDEISVISEQKETQPKTDKKFRQLILKVTQKLYFVYLLCSFGAAISLLILQPKLRQGMSLSLVLIVVYGFMLIWLALANIVFVIIQKEACAVWCNRFVAKMAIMMFSVFAVIAYLHEHFLGLYWVKIFMICTAVVSVLLILYEIYSCTCGHHEEPDYVYKVHDLNVQTNEIWKIRKDFQNNTKYKNNPRN